MALRWRWGLEGEHSPFAHRIDQSGWSLDGKKWHPLPFDMHFVFLFAGPQLNATDEVFAETQKVLGEGKTEPVYHQLFREAWSLHQDNGRSALVIGVAALEISVKQLIAKLVPNTAWLMENLPAPPVDRLLSEYLPKLQKPPFLGELNSSIPEKIVLEIKKAIRWRNEAVHVGKFDIKTERLQETLRLIKDLLWLFDFYSGNEWAKDRLSPERQSEFGILKLKEMMENTR